MNTGLKALERHAADDLAASFTNDPNAWRWTDADCDVVLGPGGIHMSVHYFTIYSPTTARFGFWNRRRIKRAFKRWKVHAGNGLADSEHHRALLLLRRCLAEPLRAVA